MKENNIIQHSDGLRDLIELFIGKWKLIVVCLIISLASSYLYLRYSTYQYESSASIKLKDDKQQNNQFSEITALQEYGLFSNNFTNVLDEMKIIKSRTILAEVVKDLNLNIRYYILGRVKEKEVYLNPPINLNFIASDSIVHKMDTTFYMTILSENKFKLTNGNSKKLFAFNDDNDAKEYFFGDPVKTSIGNVIFTPNLGEYGAQVNTLIKIDILPVNLVIESYKTKIQIENMEQSNVLNIKLQENIKVKAELIIDKLIEKYNEDAVNDKEEVIKVTSDFINSRLELVSSELEQVDLTAENLKQTNRLSDLGTQSNIFLQSEKDNERQLIETTNQIQLIDYMSEYMAQEDRDSKLLPANVGISDSNYDSMMQRYNELVLQRDRILENSSEINPIVVNLNNQINALRGNIDQSLQNLRSSNQITLDALNREDQRIRSQIYATPQKERQFRSIERQQGIKESLFLYLLEKREETAITLGMSSPNAKIIESAYTASIPVSPKRKVVYLAALILGLLVPIIFIYALDLLDTKIHTKDDLEKYVSAPFIGDIPKSLLGKKSKLVSKVDYSPKAEAFRMIRTNIDFMLQGKNKPGAKIIFITSTKAQEGKSHTSVNLSRSISFSEKKILLIETDIRVPKIKVYLNLKSDKGLTNYISDKTLSIEDVTVKVPDNNYLHVIPAGTIPPNPTELLMSNRVNDLFAQVKDAYDYVIVDTAAVGLVTDTLLLADHADMFIYVVNASKLDKRMLHVAQNMYKEKRLPNMSMLLNETEKRKGYGYGYGYGSEKKNKKWYKDLLKRS